MTQGERVNRLWGFLRDYSTTAAIALMTLILIVLFAEQRAESLLVRSFAARNACETLDHRVGSRASLRTIMQAQRGFLIVFRDIVRNNPPDDPERAEQLRLLQHAIDEIELPEAPDADLIASRNEICLEAGINIEDINSEHPPGS
jgi:hypothetical protein